MKATKTKLRILVVIMLAVSAGAQSALAQTAPTQAESDMRAKKAVEASNRATLKNGMGSYVFGTPGAANPSVAKAWALIDLGSQQLMSNSFTAAEATFREAIKTGIDDTRIYTGLAQALADQGRIAEAIQTYHYTYYDLPVEDGIKSDNPKEVEAYRANVAAHPMQYNTDADKTPQMMNYAALLAKAGQWREAVGIYEMVLPTLKQDGMVLPGVMTLHFDPETPMPVPLQAAAHLVAGINNSQRGEDTKALLEYSQAFQLQPDVDLISRYYKDGLQRVNRKPNTNAALAK